MTYWFELRRGVQGLAGGVDFIPHLIHDDSGVGTQVAAGDLNGDSLPDVISGNKKGTHVHLQVRTKVSKRIGYLLSQRCCMDDKRQYL